MIVIRPIEVTEANLSSQVPMSEPEWVAGPVPKGDERRVGVNLYRAVTDTADSPQDGIQADPPTWIHLGFINRFQMFDEYYHSQTEFDGDVEVTVSPNEVVNSVTLLNLDAVVARILIQDEQGAPIYDRSEALVDNSQIANYADYFFSPVLRRKDLTFTDLPSYSRPVQVTVTGGEGASTKVGAVLLGRQRKIGTTTYGTTSNYINGSLKERDEFGRFQIVERNSYNLISYNVAAPTRDIDHIKTFLANVANTPCVYIGDEARSGTITYGYLRDFGIPYDTVSISKFDLEVESVT
ncbi:hypothetical protein [Epibacterium ulvae]|uniref:hypothetical protein n=1 Tax=Epibacterium ulvae TaxID=1156985 RepID=UPI00248FD672|nr:hypothetical protein [Epibacterium ulvae]